MANFTNCPNCGSNNVDYVGNVVEHGKSVTYTSGNVMQYWGAAGRSGTSYSTINTESTSFTAEALRLYRVPRVWPTVLVGGLTFLAYTLFYFVLGMIQSPAGSDDNWIANIMMRGFWGFVWFMVNMGWVFLWTFVIAIAYWLLMIPARQRWKRNTAQYVNGIYCYSCRAVFADGFLGTPEEFIQKIYSQP